MNARIFAAPGVASFMAWLAILPLEPFAGPVKSDVRRVVLFEASKSGHAKSREYLNGALSRLSERHGFQLSVIRDPSRITSAELSSAQVLVIGNSEIELLPARPLRGAVEEFVGVQGKGLILVHAATAFVQDWSFLANAVVGEYTQHHPVGTSALVFADSGKGEDVFHGVRNPDSRALFQELPRSARLMDEFYGFRKSPRSDPGVNVLISLDESSLSNPRFLMGDHPLVWSKKMGAGLVVTHSLGHSLNAFAAADSFGQKLLWGEIRLAAGGFQECRPAFDTTQGPCVLKRTASIVAPAHAPTRIQAVDRCFRVFVGPPGIHRVRVTSAGGKKVYGGSVEGPARTLSTPRLPGGVYYVEVSSSSNGKLLKTLVLQ